MRKIVITDSSGLKKKIVTDLDKKIYFSTLKIHQKKKRFPSFVSGASYRLKYRTACSGDINEEDFVESFKKEIVAKFGNIGTKYENSSIGFCAEIVSFNKILKIYNKRKSISVGIAIRPKTMQAGDRCIICNTLF